VAGFSHYLSRGCNDADDAAGADNDAAGSDNDAAGAHVEERRFSAAFGRVKILGFSPSVS
jgi:hypothetical protein